MSIAFLGFPDRSINGTRLRTVTVYPTLFHIPLAEKPGGWGGGIDVQNWMMNPPTPLLLNSLSKDTISTTLAPPE